MLTLSGAGQVSQHKQDDEEWEWNLQAEVAGPPHLVSLELHHHAGLQVTIRQESQTFYYFITSFRPLILPPTEPQQQRDSTDLEFHKGTNFSEHKRILLWTTFFADPTFRLG